MGNLSGLRLAMIATLTIGLVAGGCQLAPIEPRTVCESTERAQPTEFTATEQGVFALVRRGICDNSLSDSVNPGTQKLNPPNFQPGAQIKEICVDGGSSIGFRRERNQLIGFAGPTTMPLEDGHYSWLMMTEDAAWRKARENQERQKTAITVFYICTFGVGYAAVALSPWIAAELLHADVSYGPQTMN